MSESSSLQPKAQETYLLDDSEVFRRYIASRTATIDAAFFLPYLRPGMRLLDCGCGPGSITVDLAAVVTPGEVVGIDLGAGAIAAARRLALERGVANARFEVADVHALPFPDGSFDAVFAHAMVSYLRDPLIALQEIRRVLKPSGVVGLREPDWVTFTMMEPTTPLLDAYNTLLLRVLERNGSPRYARRMRQVLMRAGFAQTKGSATTFEGAWPEQAILGTAGTLEVTRHGAAVRQIFLRDLMSATALAQGWADQATLDAMAAELRAWGERPDGFSATLWCEAVGWVSAAVPSA